MNSINCTLSCCLTVALVCAGLTSAQSPPPGTEPRNAEAYIRKSESDWAESVANGDTGVIERILAADFLGVKTDGKSYDKAAAIADTREGPKSFKSNHLEDVNIRFYGDTAVANGSEAWVRRNGQRGRFVWIDTWLKRDGKWQIVAAEDLSAPPAPGPEEEAIKTARLKQNAAILRNNIDEIASYWTEDVTICRGLGIQVAGKAAYRKLFEDDTSLPKKVVYQREPRAIEVSEHWPLAFETGVWTGRLGNENGVPIISGRYSAQWVKRDGRWLIRSEVFVALSGTGPGLESEAAP
jgi:ketosteroid isomerase-like protein